MPNKYSHGVVLAQYSSLGLIDLANNDYKGHLENIAAHDHFKVSSAWGKGGRDGLTQYTDGSFIRRHDQGARLQMPKPERPMRQSIIKEEGIIPQHQEAVKSHVPARSRPRDQRTASKTTLDSRSGEVKETVSGSGFQSRPRQTRMSSGRSPQDQHTQKRAPSRSTQRTEHTVESSNGLPTPPSSTRASSFEAPHRPQSALQNSPSATKQSEPGNKRLSTRIQLRQGDSNQSIKTQIFNPVSTTNGQHQTGTDLAEPTSRPWRRITPPPPTTLPDGIEDIYDTDSNDSFVDNDENDTRTTQDLPLRPNHARKTTNGHYPSLTRAESFIGQPISQPPHQKPPTNVVSSLHRDPQPSSTHRNLSSSTPPIFAPSATMDISTLLSTTPPSHVSPPESDVDIYSILHEEEGDDGEDDSAPYPDVPRDRHSSPNARPRVLVKRNSQHNKDSMTGTRKVGQYSMLRYVVKNQEEDWGSLPDLKVLGNGNTTTMGKEMGGGIDTHTKQKERRRDWKDRLGFGRR